MTPAEQHAAVLAALNRLEQLARDAGGQPWTAEGEYSAEDEADGLISKYGVVRRASGEVLAYPEGTLTVAEARHIAANNPTNVLVQLAGRRRILERHAPAWEDNAGIVYCDWCAAGRQVIKPAVWPGLDYRDAAAGLGVLDDTEATNG